MSFLSSMSRPFVKRRTPLDAYNCERELLLNLIEIEETGVRINLQNLIDELNLQRPILKEVEEWIKKRLGNPNINLNSPQQIVSSLTKLGMIDLEKAKRTKTGLVSTAKDSLSLSVTDKEFVSMFSYRVQLTKCINTFIEPWVNMASDNSGILYTTWNQTALSDNDGEIKGARTGRLSSSPNFQNQPKKYSPLFKHEVPEDHKKRKELLESLPECPLCNIPLMPIMRSFIIPRYDDHMLIDLDYSQQEIRILAHFENGTLMREYIRDPHMDVHQLATDLLYENLGKEVERDVVKIIVFSILYGKGTGNLAKELKCSFDEASNLKDSYYKIFPGVEKIDLNLKKRAKQGLPFTTLGGRKVFCEPPIMNKKGEWVDRAYKMLNTNLQGSAGDSIKMAINNYMRLKPKNHLPTLFVHDQILSSVPFSEVKLGLGVLKEAMESVPCDVLLLAEGKGFGAKSWDLLK